MVMSHVTGCVVPYVNLLIQCLSNTPFTRHNRLSKRLYNRCDNRLYRVNKHPTGCQSGCQRGLTTGWMFVYTIQPVVKPVWQPVVSWILTFTRLLNNRFNNRLYRWHGAKERRPHHQHFSGADPGFWKGGGVREWVWGWKFPIGVWRQTVGRSSWDIKSSRSWW